MVVLETLYEGAKFIICAIAENGVCHVQDFIASLEESKQKKILALLKYSATNGPPKNEQKFKKLNDPELWEFKEYQTRIFCVFEKGKKIILTHGWIKKDEKTPKRQIVRAHQLLEMYRNER